MFGNRIKQLREEKKMTQVQLANVMGVTEETVALWEQGKQEPCIARSCQQFFAQMAKPSRADIKIPSEPRAGVFRE